MSKPQTSKKDIQRPNLNINELQKSCNKGLQIYLIKL